MLDQLWYDSGAVAWYVRVHDPNGPGEDVEATMSQVVEDCLDKSNVYECDSEPDAHDDDYQYVLCVGEVIAGAEDE